MFQCIASMTQDPVATGRRALARRQAELLAMPIDHIKRLAVPVEQFTNGVVRLAMAAEAHDGKLRATFVPAAYDTSFVEEIVDGGAATSAAWYAREAEQAPTKLDAFAWRRELAQVGQVVFRRQPEVVALIDSYAYVPGLALLNTVASLAGIFLDRWDFAGPRCDWSREELELVVAEAGRALGDSLAAAPDAISLVDRAANWTVARTIRLQQQLAFVLADDPEQLATLPKVSLSPPRKPRTPKAQETTEAKPPTAEPAPATSTPSEG